MLELFVFLISTEFHDYMAQVRPRTVKLLECWSIYLLFFFFYVFCLFCFSIVFCFLCILFFVVFLSSVWSCRIFCHYAPVQHPTNCILIKYLTSLVGNEFKEYKRKPTTKRFNHPNVHGSSFKCVHSRCQWRKSICKWNASKHQNAFRKYCHHRCYYFIRVNIYLLMCQ